MRYSKILTLILILLLATQIASQETYFGKNKVRYKNFDWEFIQTRHFDIHFYEDVYPSAKFAAEVLEASYEEIAHELSYRLQRRVPVFIYNSQNDFQQTNITSGLLPEGVAGFTEVFKTRIVLPFDGSYESFRETLHHELTHAMTYDLLYGNFAIISTRRLFAQPLWFAEGFAAYSSRHGWDYWSDMFVRDATINGYMIPPSFLSGYQAYRQGQALIKYIADEFGEDKLGEILKKGKVLLTMKKALKSSLGIDEEELYKRFLKEMKRRYWPEIALRDEVEDIGLQLTKARKDGSFFNEAPTFSPDGDRLAIFSDISDYTEIIMISAVDGKLIKRMVKSQRSGDLESLHAYVSGISFSPDGENLVFVAKSGGKEAILFYNIRDNDVYQKKPLDYYSIIDPAWSPDGKKIAFSALDKHKRDLFVYDIESDQIEQLTDDRFDDISPSWMPNSEELVFSSDRHHPQNIERNIEDHPYSPANVILPGDFEYGVFNLFRMKITGRDLVPVEAGPGQNKRPKVSPDGDKIAFISNRNGIDNIYISELEDKNSFAITDILTGIRNIDWSPNGDRIAFSAMNSGAFDIFIIKDIVPVGENGVLTKTAFVLGEYDTPFRNEPGPPSDSLAADSTAEGLASADQNDVAAVSDSLEAEDAIEGSETAATPPDDDSESDEAVITETGTHGDEFVYVGTDLEKDPLDSLMRKIPKDSTGFYQEMLPEPAHFDSVPPLLPNGEYEVQKYKLRFTPDYIGGGFAYDTHFGMRGQTQFVFSDYLGNHQIFISTDLMNTIDQSIIQVIYLNNENRINFGGGFFHSKNYYIDNQNYLFSDRYYGLLMFLKRPFSTFSRLELNGAQYFVDRKYPEATDLRENTGFRITTAGLSYVFDNILWGHTGPINGMRTKFTIEGAKDLLDKNEYEYYAASFDFRQYWHIDKGYSFAFRLCGGGSDGKTPKRYFLGGTTNFIGRRSFDDAVYEVDNLYFSDIITPLRGLGNYALNGNRFALMNAEFRFPMIDYFVTRFPLAFAITNVTGSIFLDIGSTWENDNFKWGNSKSGLGQEGVISGFGFGMRANMFGFLLLRYDLAWLTDYNSVSDKPTYYFSFGADF